MVDGACNVAELNTNLTERENDDLMFSIGDDIGGLSNPVIMSGDVWPVSEGNMYLCDYYTLIFYPHRKI